MMTALTNRINFKSPKWLLFIGLTGVSNFLASSWFLLPPTNERMFFFWFAKFYQYLRLPSLALLTIGVLSIAIWLSRITVSTTSYVLQDIKHDGYYYYIVENYDDMAVEYYFCRSGKLGFSGKCEYLQWGMADSRKPNLFIDVDTQYVVVEFEEQHYFWVNSEPPICVTDISEIRNTENLVNNECPP